MWPNDDANPNNKKKKKEKTMTYICLVRSQYEQSSAEMSCASA
jgi:hypothetical protein